MSSVELRIPPLPEYVSLARLCVAGICARRSLPLETIEELKVALAEACTNAIQHAYPSPQEEDFVRISFYLEGEMLTIAVEDTGKGFDPEQAIQPPSAERERGLGIFLMKALVSSVEIHSAPGQGTRIVLKKGLDEEGQEKS